jgi:ribosomal protein S12 methylthiotransferase accessory factor
MEMIIDFPGGLKVDAHFGPYKVETDQAGPNGSTGNSPTPFSTFLASIGTCAGIYVLGFCQRRGISTEGIRIVQKMNSNPFSGMVTGIDLEIQLPDEFPEKYRLAVERAGEQCAVKKHFENPPQINVYTTVGEEQTVEFDRF